VDTPGELPDIFEHDIERAKTILQEEGCAQVFLFGSASRGEVHADSDIDLAVSGCPRGHFFSLIRFTKVA
jgi:predicted nucleotidyltransferase